MDKNALIAAAAARGCLDVQQFLQELLRDQHGVEGYVVETKSGDRYRIVADGTEAVMMASFAGNVAVLKFMHDVVHADLAAHDNLPARLAAANGKLASLQFLDGKPGVDFAARDNETAKLAAAAGHGDVLAFLKDKPGVTFTAEHLRRASLAAFENPENISAMRFLERKQVEDYFKNNPLMDIGGKQ